MGTPQKQICAKLSYTSVISTDWKISHFIEYTLNNHDMWYNAGTFFTIYTCRQFRNYLVDTKADLWYTRHTFLISTDGRRVHFVESKIKKKSNLDM